MNLAVAGVHLGEPIGRDALLKLGAGGESPLRPAAAAAGRPALRRRAAGPAGRVRRHPPGRGGRVRLPGRAAPGGCGRAPVPRRPLVPDRVRPRPGRGPDLPGRPDRRPARARASRRRPELPAGFDVDSVFGRDPWQFGDGEEVEVDVLVDGAESGRVVAELGDRGGGRAPGRRRRGGAAVGHRPGGAASSGCSTCSTTPRCSAPEPVRAAVVERLAAIAAGRRSVDRR